MFDLLRRLCVCFTIGLVVAFAGSANVRAASDIAPGTPGAEGTPLRVMLVPTDGGTEDGTLADFEPIFNAVSRTSGLKFELRVGHS